MEHGAKVDAPNQSQAAKGPCGQQVHAGVLAPPSQRSQTGNSLMGGVQMP